MSKEWTLNSLFRSSSEAAGAGAGAGAEIRACRTALRICCKLSLEWLGTLVAAAGDFAPWGPAGYLENSDSGGRKELGGATEGRSQRR